MRVSILKYLLVSGFILISSACFSQDIKVQVFKEKGDSIYKLKVLNNASEPIGIRCSIGFVSLTESDTLKLSLGEWYNGNGSDFYYSLESAEADSKFSEPIQFYQLLVLSPHTYLSTNLLPSDYNRYVGKNVFFSVNYTKELTVDELAALSKRDKKNIIGLKREKKFLTSKTKMSPIE